MATKLILLQLMLIGGLFLQSTDSESVLPTPTPNTTPPHDTPTKGIPSPPLSAVPTKDTPTPPLSAGPTKDTPTPPLSAEPTKDTQMPPFTPLSAVPTKDTPTPPLSAEPTKDAQMPPFTPLSAVPTKGTPTPPLSAEPTKDTSAPPPSAESTKDLPTPPLYTWRHDTTMNPPTNSLAPATNTPKKDTSTLPSETKRPITESATPPTIGARSITRTPRIKTDTYPSTETPSNQHTSITQTSSRRTDTTTLRNWPTPKTIPAFRLPSTVVTESPLCRLHSHKCYFDEEIARLCPQTCSSNGFFPDALTTPARQLVTETPAQGVLKCSCPVSLSDRQSYLGKRIENSPVVYLAKDEYSFFATDSSALTNFSIMVPPNLMCDQKYSRDTCAKACADSARSGFLYRNGAYARIDGDYYRPNFYTSSLANYMCYRAGGTTTPAYLTLHSQVISCPGESIISNAISVLDDEFSCSSSKIYKASYRKNLNPTWPTYGEVPIRTTTTTTPTPTTKSPPACHCGIAVEASNSSPKLFSSQSIGAYPLYSGYTCEKASSLCEVYCKNRGMSNFRYGLAGFNREMINLQSTPKSVQEPLGDIVCNWMGGEVTPQDGASVSLFSRVDHCPSTPFGRNTESNPKDAYSISKRICCDKFLKYSLCY